MAKKFQFRLQQVLNFRKQVEENCVRELARVKGDLLRHEELMEAHEMEEKFFLDQYRDLGKSGYFNVNDAILCAEAQEYHLKRQKNDQNRTKELSELIEEKRVATVHASENRQLLENLKSRKRDLNLLEGAREDQKFLDEVSAIAFVRRNRAEKLAKFDQ